MNNEFLIVVQEHNKTQQKLVNEIQKLSMVKK